MSVVKEGVARDAQSEPMPLPSGPAAAAILSGGIGTAVYGFIVLMSAASTGVANALNWYKPTGPLSGKTTLGVILWLVAWGVLGKTWKGKDVDINKIWVVSAILIFVGLLFTFPPVFDLFAAH